MTQTTSNNHRRWLRFSLRSMIATTVILILGVSHWNTSRELMTTRAELSQLQRATGQLVVRDPARLHVKALQTVAPREKAFLWHVYVPAGTSYRLTLELDDLFPTSPGEPTKLSIPLQGATVLTPGEWKIWYEYTRNTDEDRWDTAMTLATPDESDSAYESLRTSNLPWLQSDWEKSFHVAGFVGTDAFDATETVDLLDLVAMPRSSGQATVGPMTNLQYSSKIRVRLTPMKSH